MFAFIGRRAESADALYEFFWMFYPRSLIVIVNWLVVL